MPTRHPNFVTFMKKLLDEAEQVIVRMDNIDEDRVHHQEHEEDFFLDSR
jgi:hypothetical protein